MLELDIAEDGPVTVLSIQGNLKIGDDESAFRKAVAQLVEQGRVNIVIDCSGLTIVDSTGLGALIRTLRNTRDEGGKTKLLHVGSHLHRLLEMTELLTVFETYEDRDEAVRSF